MKKNTKKRKRAKNMAELTKGHQKFISDKELNNDGLNSFNVHLNKATKGK